MRIDRRLLGWGLFLIIVGAIPLLVRAGYLTADQLRPWPTLWPLLLIGWGLTLVLRRTPGEVLGNALNLIVFGIMGGGLIATGFSGVPAFGACGDGEGGSAFGGRSGSLAEPANVSIEFNCGSLAVNAIDGEDWSIAGTGPDGQGPAIESDATSVQVAPPDADFMGFVNAGSDWRIELPRTPLLDLGVTLNAGEGSVDMSGANLGNATLTLNAGSMTFRLAGAAALESVNATVNAGSATMDLPGSVADLNLTLNAGSISVCLPEGTKILAGWSGALGSNNFDDIGLIKIDDQHWETAGLDRNEPHVELDVSANAGSFDLTLGGSCDA